MHVSLLHRYSFDGTGTTVTDSVGTADGTCVNCLVRDGAIDLQSSADDDYVELPSGILSGLGAVTVEVWLEWDGGSNHQRIFDFGSNNGNSGTTFLTLVPRNGDNALAIVANFTSGTVVAANDVLVRDTAALSQLGVHQVAVTYDGSGLALYRDGTSVARQDGISEPLSAIDDSHNWLGRSQFTPDPELDAILYEFRIYSAALTASEIQASFDAGQNP